MLFNCFYEQTKRFLPVRVFNNDNFSFIGYKNYFAGYRISFFHFEITDIEDPAAILGKSTGAQNINTPLIASGSV